MPKRFTWSGCFAPESEYYPAPLPYDFLIFEYREAFEVEGVSHACFHYDCHYPSCKIIQMQAGSLGIYVDVDRKSNSKCWMNPIIRPCCVVLNKKIDLETSLSSNISFFIACIVLLPSPCIPSFLPERVEIVPTFSVSAFSSVCCVNYMQSWYIRSEKHEKAIFTRLFNATGVGAESL